MSQGMDLEPEEAIIDPTEKTLPKTYTIVTIADAFEQIPPDKVDAFLRDLSGMMKYHKRLVGVLSDLAKQEIWLELKNGFVWIDDGKHDLKLMIK